MTSSTTSASLWALLVVDARQGVLLVVILARWGRGTRLDSARCLPVNADAAADPAQRRPRGSRSVNAVCPLSSFPGGVYSF